MTGDFTSAEEAFAQALSFDRNPVPGLALLRARRGNVPGAVTTIDAALREAATPAARVQLLDAGVEIAIAAGVVDGLGCGMNTMATLVTRGSPSSPGSAWRWAATR